MSEADDAPIPCPKCGAARNWVYVKTSRGRIERRGKCLPCKRAWDARNRAQHGGAAARNRAWESRNQEKNRAHKIVEMALAKGSLVRKPCQRCGSLRVHAHHEDYSQPLEVMWLCPLHHKERHRELASADSSPAAATSPSRSSHRDGDTIHGAAQ